MTVKGRTVKLGRFDDELEAASMAERAREAKHSGGWEQFYAELLAQVRIFLPVLIT